MNILSIGNSFSQDAQRYAHGIAKADGFELDTFNLMIGGCSLFTHFKNMISEQREYTLEMNGKSTGFKVSLKEALINREWDVVTVQQASNFSPYYETYQPYLNEIVKYIRNYAPKAKIAIHQTWAYEEDSKKLIEGMGYKKQEEMFNDIKNAYKKAFEDIKADIIIPSGEVFQKLIANGIEKVHRDTFHAKLGIGRYTLGLLWYSIFSNNDVKNNTFSDFDEEISEKEIEIAKKCVAEICKK